MKVIQHNKIKETKGEIVVLTSEKQKVTLELNYYEPDSPYNTPYEVGEGLDHLAFQVEDYDRFLEEADHLGFPKIHEVTTEHSRWAYIEDPNGIWIEINKQEN
jgi:catechol 2,3-dioxygenase-like lactoylglutathione lyase family enzyme